MKKFGTIDRDTAPMGMAAVVRLRGSRLALLLPVLLLVPACGLSDDSPFHVTIGGIDIAPPDMRRAEGPAARYVAASDTVIFVSAPLYSGSCPPGAQADMDGRTLVLDVDDSADGDCTADAKRNTFLIQGVNGKPTRLVVEQGELESIELDLGH